MWRAAALVPALVLAVSYSTVAFQKGDSAEELCLPLLAFSLWCLLRAFKEKGAVRPGLWLVFANGLAAGAVFWVKYTLLGLHFAWMACLAFWLWLGEKSFSSALKACGAFLGGMAAVSVPVLAYFAFHNSLGDLFGTYFVTNFTSYSDAPSNWTVPFYNMAVSGLSTLTSNPVWMGLALLGGAWLLFAPRLLTGAGRAALAAMAFFTAFFIWCGSMGWPYYGLPLAVFAPLGFADWRCATSLISGFIAKESVVSTLEILLGGAALSTLFASRAAISFLVFTLLYTPCIAAVATIRREFNSTLKTVGVVLMQCCVAWIVAFVVYTLVGIL